MPPWPRVVRALMEWSYRLCSREELWRGAPVCGAGPVLEEVRPGGGPVTVRTGSYGPAGDARWRMPGKARARGAGFLPGCGGSAAGRDRPPDYYGLPGRARAEPSGQERVRWSRSPRAGRTSLPAARTP
ncbi:hypothetical protein GCM10009733_011810 [Nonomuraea maheshkhaliensis]|uniref:Uncharacterized protein n=1 Tax=Nonomuraea maheshkhaliensis TaxID=419590 RepID=A0ABP4QTF4_9ACTN